MALYALGLIERKGWDETRPLAAAAVAALLMLLAYGSRSMGAALAVAFVLHEAAVQRRVRLFSVAVILGFGAGVVLLSASFYDTRVYRTHFPVIPSAYLENALFYLRSPASLWAVLPPRSGISCSR